MQVESILVTPPKPENYLSPVWKNRVRAEMQYNILKTLLPAHLQGEEQDRWALAWVRRYAIPFSNWLEADEKRFTRIAKRLHQGIPYSSEELRAIALELENY